MPELSDPYMVKRALTPAARRISKKERGDIVRSAIEAILELRRCSVPGAREVRKLLSKQRW